jgi:hypothetical protein
MLAQVAAGLCESSPRTSARRRNTCRPPWRTNQRAEQHYPDALQLSPRDTPMVVRHVARRYPRPRSRLERSNIRNLVSAGVGVDERAGSGGRAAEQVRDTACRQNPTESAAKGPPKPTS